ncbi:PAS domain S-box protein, partial [Pseudomonas sp. FSL R10-0056]
MFDLHRKADLLENKRLSCSLDEMTARTQAISRSMAIIEFAPDGTILEANDNFCAVTGYAIDEIRGKHHRIFCEEPYTRTSEYVNFWRDLANGQAMSGTYLRLDKA